MSLNYNNERTEICKYDDFEVIMTERADVIITGFRGNCVYQCYVVIQNTKNILIIDDGDPKNEE